MRKRRVIIRVVSAFLALHGLMASASAQSFSIIQVANNLPTADSICSMSTGLVTSGLDIGTTCIAHPAVCNGVTDDSQSLIDFNTWVTGTFQVSNPGKIIELLSTGANCIINGTVTCPTAGTTACPFAGIKNLIVSGYGSKWTVSQFEIGGTGIPFNNTTSNAPTQTVSAGATCVTLVTAANANNFVVGSRALMTGFNIQSFFNGGGFGYPPNLHYFDFEKITSSNASTGQVCFDVPLRYKYESTWPLYDSGGVTTPSEGGPAMLYQFDPSWDMSIEFRGLTITASGQVLGNARSVTYRDFKITNADCIIPTQNQTWTVINSDLSACSGVGSGLEVDKLIGTVSFQGGTLYGIVFQSSSTDLLSINGTTVLHEIHGTPKRFVGINATINTLTVGTIAYGRSESASCTNCNITTFGSEGAVIGTWGGFCTPAGVNNRWTMSGGVITIPNGSSACGDDVFGWAVPGTNAFWTGAYNSETLFHVVDVTQDVTNTYVQTDLAGGFPGVPLDPNVTPNGLYIRVHPSPQFTCTGCTGTAGTILAAWPAGNPVYSYSQCTFDGSIGSNIVNCLNAWGNLATLTLNVTNGYSGAGNLTFNFSAFGNYPTINSSNATANYGPQINAKTAGTRTVTLSSVTGCQTGDGGGACPGDLSVPDSTTTWFTGSTGSSYSADVSGSCPGAGCPSVTVTIQTNQGVVIPP